MDNRRYENFFDPKVIEVLPEYFGSEYPKLVTLLNAYYEYMDSDGGVNDNIKDILKARDIDGVSLSLLDFLLKETGGGISKDYFVQPRENLKRFPSFFRLKGSLFSAKMFFRALYGEEVDISYPKDQVFIVGESKLGAESFKYIQNGELYQTLSVLIKSPISISQWRDLYKVYVHPAGFYLGGEVILEDVVDLNADCMPIVILDSDISLPVISTITSSMYTTIEPTYGFHNENDSDYSIMLNRQISTLDSTITPSMLDSQYGSIFDYQQPVTITMDMDSTAGPDLSNTITTIDEDTV